MKIKISKILLILSYVTAAILAIFAAFSIYDWFAISQDDSYAFWTAMHTNAAYLIWSSVIGIVFALPIYISNFNNEQNKIYKIRSRNMLSVFLFVLMVAIVLCFSPIEIPNTFDAVL